MTKQKTKKKMSPVHMLITQWERNQLQIKADLYAGGNLTAYLVFQGLNGRAKFLTVEETKRKES